MPAVPAKLKSNVARQEGNLWRTPKPMHADPKSPPAANAFPALHAASCSPCPFCGEGKSIVSCYQTVTGGFTVGCGACGAHSGVSHCAENVIDHWNTRQEAKASSVDEALKVAREALKDAAYELNAIRARDGAPQHIDWCQGRPLQTSSCTHEYFSSVVDACHNSLNTIDQLLAKPTTTII